MSAGESKYPEKILIVDDETVVADTLGAILSSQGYDVRTAYSGAAAIEAARSFGPDVLISDIRMPGISGLDAAELITQSLPRCGIILFSGHMTATMLKDQRIEDFGWTVISKPVPPQELLASVAAILARKSKEPLTILNVDDAEIARYAVTHILQHAGFRVKEAATGAEALRLAQTRPDLILLDIHLPDMTGFDVCMRLRQSPETAHIPIVHLTNTCRDEVSRQRALALGANGYLTQPVEPEPLVALLRRLASPGTAIAN